MKKTITATVVAASLALSAPANAGFFSSISGFFSGLFGGGSSSSSSSGGGYSAENRPSSFGGMKQTFVNSSGKPISTRNVNVETFITTGQYTAKPH